MTVGRGHLVVAGALALLWTCTASAQTDEERAAARAAAKEGVRAFAEGRYQEALDYCTRAEAVMHAPTHLLLIARADAKLGHLVEAQEAYFRIQRDPLAAGAPPAFVEAHEKAAQEQAALASRIPTLRVVLQGGKPADVTVTVDGAALPAALVDLASPVNPGERRVEAKGARLASDPVTITIAEGAKEAVTLTLLPLPGGDAAGAPNGASSDESMAVATPALSETPRTSHARRIGGWVGLGVGAAGVVAGTLFVAKNRSDRSDANALCASGCPASRRADVASLDDSANSAATLAWISYGIGAAAAVTGVVLLWTDATKPARASTGSVRPWIGMRSAGLTVAF